MAYFILLSGFLGWVCLWKKCCVPLKEMFEWKRGSNQHPWHDDVASGVTWKWHHVQGCSSIHPKLYQSGSRLECHPCVITSLPGCPRSDIILLQMLIPHSKMEGPASNLTLVARSCLTKTFTMTAITWQPQACSGTASQRSGWHSCMEEWPDVPQEVAMSAEWAWKWMSKW